MHSRHCIQQAGNPGTRPAPQEDCVATPFHPARTSAHRHVQHLTHDGPPSVSVGAFRHAPAACAPSHAADTHGTRLRLQHIQAPRRSARSCAHPVKVQRAQQHPPLMASSSVSGKWFTTPSAFSAGSGLSAACTACTTGSSCASLRPSAALATCSGSPVPRGGGGGGACVSEHKE